MGTLIDVLLDDSGILGERTSANRKRRYLPIIVRSLASLLAKCGYYVDLRINFQPVIPKCKRERV